MLSGMNDSEVVKKAQEYLIGKNMDAEAPSTAVLRITAAIRASTSFSMVIEALRNSGIADHPAMKRALGFVERAKICSVNKRGGK